MLNKVEYVDLGLPSGNLWSEQPLPVHYSEFSGIMPCLNEMTEICINCKTESNFIIGPNGNKIVKSPLYFHLIKYGSSR